MPPVPVGSSVKVTRSATRSRSARRRRSASSGPWPATTNSGVDARVDDAPGRGQEGRQPRARRQGAGGADDADRAGPGGRPPVGLLLGDRQARGHHRDHRGRDAHVAHQVVGQLAADGHEPPAPGPAQPDPLAPGQALLDRQHVGDAPGLGQRQARLGDVALQHVHQVGTPRRVAAAEPAHRPRAPPAAAQDRAGDDAGPRVQDPRARDVDDLGRDAPRRQPADQPEDRSRLAGTEPARQEDHPSHGLGHRSPPRPGPATRSGVAGAPDSSMIPDPRTGDVPGGATIRNARHGLRRGAKWPRGATEVPWHLPAGAC
jgi:hypothetical protein